MLSVAIIVFREILEIALILSVVIAATHGLKGRNLWTAIGMAGGVAGAGVVALFAGALTHAASGMGQEIFNAAILFTACALIGGTAVWMRTHARHAAMHLKDVGHAVVRGKLPLYSLSIVIALAVWREGAEIVLFLYGMALSGHSAFALTAGSIAGLASGVAVGVMLYYGLLKMAARRMFQVTGWLLILLSAGMASQGAKLLVDGGVLTQMITPVWNTAGLLPEGSLLGQALHALIGYSARPLGIQVVFYLGTVLVLLAAMRVIAHGMKKQSALKAAVFALLLVHPGAARALDGEVFSPRLVKGEAEVEYSGTHTFDKDAGRNNQQENEFEFGYTFTDWWKAELGGALERETGMPQDYTTTELANFFQFWPTDKYWLDAGVLVSYHFAAKRDDADSIEAKLLLQKDFGRITTLVNLGGEREVGGNSTVGNDLSSVVNARYRWLRQFEPGVELQSGYGMWGDHNNLNQQEHYFGPIAYGEILPETIPGLKYEAGVYAGLTGSSASTAARLHIEYEMYF